MIKDRYRNSDYESVADYKAMLFDLAAGEDDFTLHRYSSLFHHLFARIFYFNVGNDVNRAKDGLNMRNHFAWRNHISEDFWKGIMPEECTVLEMMLALARRWNDEFLWDPDYGDRTHKWFFEMLKNLGLDFYHNGNFDGSAVDRILDIFMSRSYNRDGFRGGMFPVEEHPQIDMRKAELWYQMNYYLEENYDF